MGERKVKFLDKHDNLDLTRFEMEYLKGKKPVIISNSFKWKALEKWNLDYFKKIYPDKMVALTVLNPTQNTLGSNVTLKLPEAIELINNNTDKNKKYYLMQRSVHDEFPELIPDIAIPNYADNSNIHVVNLWVGEKGINTKPHHDYYNNFLTQIFGRKRVRLFPPSDTQFLYPYSMNDTMTVEGVQYPTVHVSQIADIDLVDTNEFPDIKLATSFEGVLNPGDLLYIPAGWWHEVKSLDVTMSINFWWKIRIEEFPLQQLAIQVGSYFNWFGDSFHNRIRSAFDLSEYRDDLQVAEFCLLKNLKCVSAFFLLTYLDRMLININTDFKVNKILEWKKYLEVSKNCIDELLDSKKILHIINETKIM